MAMRYGGYDAEGNLKWFEGGLAEGYTVENPKAVAEEPKKRGPGRPSKEELAARQAADGGE